MLVTSEMKHSILDHMMFETTSKDIFKNMIDNEPILAGILGTTAELIQKYPNFAGLFILEFGGMVYLLLEEIKRQKNKRETAVFSN